MTQVQRHVPALLALGAVGAAGMFLGAEGPFGLDFGSFGVTPPYAALWVVVVYVAEVFPEAWSPAEKQAWVAVVFVALIVIASLLGRLDADNEGRDERDLPIAHAAARFADGAMTLLIVWLVVALLSLPEHSRTWLRPMIVASVLIALLIARALAENIYTVPRYRGER